ncbi:hypothetical protein BC374_02475 [Ensifer sp. LC13]|nr:hypothetical protein BC374_02475 [Ensifer sp. LC13]OCP11619.1 hypothetical protein BC362_06860 [Ensifer sp. LC14]OCP32694.1 hypothetical protein BC364_02475 [Ensifer sp. LC499]
MRKPRSPSVASEEIAQSSLFSPIGSIVVLEKRRNGALSTASIGNCHAGGGAANDEINGEA